MLRTASILLACSLVPAFGQFTTSSRDSNPSNNSGSGSPMEAGGVVTNSRSAPRLFRGGQIDRPVVMTGSVLLASGEKPLDPVLIKRICGASVTPEGYSDSKGKFSFRIGGGSSLAATMNASVGNDRPDDLVTGVEKTTIGLVDADPTGGIDLSGCSLVADAPGYRSAPIVLTRMHTMGRGEVGQFILTPLGGKVASAVSITTLEAPKGAQKAYEKALKEARKGESAKVAKVIAALEQAVALYPRYAAAWTLLGQVRMQEGDIPGAETALENALEADQRYVLTYEPLILLRVGQKDWKRTAILADFVLSFDPANTNVRWYQTVAFFQLGSLDEAAASIDKLQSDKQAAAMFPQMHHLRGLIYAQRGEFEDAAAEYKQYLELAPDSVAGDTIKQQLDQWETRGAI
ncbi:MAG: tetratricopeptide repeat protein [Acidobacteria bacterium]|nr:tetratricopeptide repeat protein [Acidobacteriota bacterium]MDA1235821.1 tetratricopeptide repeat protein [Acidobacteriota bacterium]